MDEDIKSEMANIMDDMNSDKFINMYYDQEQHEIAVKNTLIYDARQEGKAEGIDIGKAEGIDIGKTEEKLEIAKKMLESNMAEDIILNITGITKEELENLK